MQSLLIGVVAACILVGASSTSADSSIIQINVNNAGAQANNYSGQPAISANGRYVAFESPATNLVPGDNFGNSQIFIRDTVSGTTSLVSADNAGVQGNGYSAYPGISADGRYVAFQSGANNLVAGDINNTYDIFIRDTVSGTTSLVSADNAGVQGDDTAFSPAISADGRYVAFHSGARNLVPGDSNFGTDVFLRDTVSGTTSLVSLDSAGAQGNSSSYNPTISGNGRYVAFQSNAYNLVPGDSNLGISDVFIHDTVGGTTTLVSVNSAGVQGDSQSDLASLSADGRYVAFRSHSSNLVEGDTNGFWDIFVRDTVGGTTTRVSVNDAGVQGNAVSVYSDISAGGRYVAFNSEADNLVPGDINNTYDIFIRDTVRGTTTRVSVDSAGVQGDGASISPVMSADGCFAAFESSASNLVAGDANGQPDVFRVRTAPQSDSIGSTTPEWLCPGSYLSPGPELLSSNVLLSWNSVPGATYYEITIRDVDSGVMAVNSTSAATIFSTLLAPGRAYKWNVAACNALGCSSFTQALFFRTSVAAIIGPPTPKGLSPGDGAWPESVYGTQVTLTWTPVPGAAAYSVNLYDKTAGQSVTIPLVVGATSTTIPMTTGNEYRWSVASCSHDSVNNDLNCPNRADEIRFVQGNGSAWINGKKPGISGFITEASSSVDSLILVTHGWNSDAVGWADPLVNRICDLLADTYGSPPNTTDRVNGGRECVIGRWRVMSYDWAAASCKKPDSLLPGCLPDEAVMNGADQGSRLGDQARGGVRYKFIHLIAHSAGSRLVQAFANRYNCWGDGTPCGPIPQAAVHMTLFDSYCPSVLVCSYGSRALWAEQYVDYRPLGGNTFFSSEKDTSAGTPPAPLNLKTNVTLANARTFDVTELDNIQDYAGPNAEGYHAFPFRQYLDSAGVAPEKIGEFNASRISDLNPKLGASLAAWAHQDAAKPSFSPAAHVQSMANRFGRTGRLYLFKESWRASTTAIDTAVTTDPTFISTDFTYTPLDENCTANSTASTIGVGTCVPATLSSRLTPLSATPDPGMMLVSATLNNVADRLSFDYQFTSAASVGYLEVFVDNALVFIVVSDDNAGSVQHAGPIEIARLEPGPHELRVVVKSDTAENASVVLSNIVFDRITPNVPGAPLMTVATAGNHQATVVFSEAAYNGGAPVTGFTVTSNPAGGIDSQAGTLGEGHVITGLNNGTAYTFTVTATNSAGISAPSAPSNSVTPLAVEGLSVGDVSLVEGNSGTQLATFTVSLSAPSASPVSFDISTDIGMATPGSDFVAKSQAGVTIAAGQTTASFAVTINGETTVEGNETFTVNLTNAVGADVVDGQGLGTIVNDDNATLSIADVALVEGNSGISTATFIVTLSNPMPTPVTFDIATSNGSAEWGSDYVARNQAARVLDAGRTRSLFEVTVDGDVAVEGNETFSVTVSNVIGATLGDGAAIGTIQNDDAAAVKTDEGTADENGTIETKSIAQIQGGGVVSPWQGKLVSAEGIVTALTSDGLFIQTADAHRDGNPTTAEGIFVATADGSIKIGDAVRVQGMVREAQIGDDPNQLTLTQIVATRVLLLSSGNALPQAMRLDASNAGAHQAITGLERYEGMRVSVPVLNVIAPAGGNINETTGQAQSNGRFYGVAAGVARPFREPGISALDRASGRRGASPPVFDTNPERLLIDSLGQRGAPALPADAGDTVTGLVGVLGYGNGAYQVLPDPTASVIITSGASPKPASMPTVAQATIGSLNLRRFLDDRQASSEPVLTPAAYALRVAKTANVICAYARTPDILGVAEVENRTTLSDLAAAVNGNDGNVLFPANCQGDAGYRAYLLPGNDARQRNLGFLVSTAPVRPGVPRVEVLSVTQAGNDVRFRQRDGSYEPLNERPPLILQARINEATGRSSDVTVVANHLSALDGNLAAPGARGWTTRGDYLRARRAAQALSLAQLVQARQRANSQEKLVVLGDFGASEFNQGHDDLMGVLAGREAPRAKVLRHVGSPITPPLTNLTTLVPELERYTDIRDGNAQALSHVLVNKALLTDYPDLHLETVRINADFAMDHFGDSTVPMRAADSDPQVLYLERH